MMFVKIEGVLIKKKVPVVLESNLSKKKSCSPPSRQARQIRKRQKKKSTIMSHRCSITNVNNATGGKTTTKNTGVIRHV